MIQHQKQLLTRLIGLVGLFCVLAAAPSWAQYKVAYVDTDAVIMAMPGYRITQRTLEDYQKKLVEELEAEKRAIAKFYKEIVDRMQVDQVSPKEQEEAEAKLQTMQEQLQRKTQQADQRIVDKEQALTAPLYQQFEAALALVAKKNDYAYILDKKLMLYSAGGVDATQQLKQQLGL